MLTNHGRLVVLLLATSLIEPTAAHHERQRVNGPTRLSAPDVVALLALKGVPGGVVALSTSPRQRVIGESEFDAWIRDMRWGVSELEALAARAANPGEVVAEFVRQDAEKRWSGRPLTSGVQILRDSRAGACEAVLRRPLKQPVRGNNILRLLSRAVSGATGTPTPGGYVGTCVGIGQQSNESIDISAGRTLEEALNRVVAHYGGAAWVAVQDSAGNCSLGVIQQSVNADKLCVMTLAKYPPAVKPLALARAMLRCRPPLPRSNR